MKRIGILYAFGVVLLAELAALFFQWNSLHEITKLLLLPALLIFAALQVVEPPSLKLPLLAALFFSWIGDALLLFDTDGGIYFILGLAAFLIAHLFYCFLFNRIGKALRPRNWNLILIVPILLYTGFLLYTLFPSLGDLKIPVTAYALVLTSMFILAANALPLNTNTGKLLAISAALFVLSDSLLAINKFYTPIPQASISIMLTYALAQLGLVYGVIAHALSPNKP